MATIFGREMRGSESVDTNRLIFLKLDMSVSLDVTQSSYISILYLQQYQHDSMKAKLKLVGLELN
jgi:hypothetical protein